MKKDEPARRVRGCVQAILDAVMVLDYRTGGNPAR